MSHLPPAKHAKIVRHVKNAGFRSGPFPNSKTNLNDEIISTAQETIIGWRGYSPTPLISLETIAAACGVHSACRGYCLKTYQRCGAIATPADDCFLCGRDDLVI